MLLTLYSSALEWWHYQLFDARRHPALCASAVPGGPM